MRSPTAVALLCFLTGCGRPGTAPPAFGTDVTFKASDGEAVFAREDRPEGKARAVILLFHQAGSSSGEYAETAKRLNKAGFATVAVDQRSGGEMYGVNRTVKARGGSTDYISAYPDLEGALDYAKGFNAPVVAWGSSYSSCLVFKLASERPEVKAVVSFSPGEYYGKPGTVAGWVAACKCPSFIACGEGESDKAKEVAQGATVHTYPGGIHGSSTLIPAKSKASEAYWADVTAFLDKQFPKG